MFFLKQLIILCLFYAQRSVAEEDSSCVSRCQRLHTRSLSRISLDSESLHALLERQRPEERLREACWRVYDFLDCGKRCESSREFEKFARISQRQCAPVMKDVENPLRCISRYHSFIEIRCSAFMKEAIRLREKVGREYTPDVETCRYLHLNGICLENAVGEYCPEGREIFRRLSFRDNFLSFILPEDDSAFDDEDLDSCQVYDFVKKAIPNLTTPPTSTEVITEAEEETVPPVYYSPSATELSHLETTTMIERELAILEERNREGKEESTPRTGKAYDNQTQIIDRELATLDAVIKDEKHRGVETSVEKETTTELQTSRGTPARVRGNQAVSGKKQASKEKNEPTPSRITVRTKGKDISDQKQTTRMSVVKDVTGRKNLNDKTQTTRASIGEHGERQTTRGNRVSEQTQNIREDADAQTTRGNRLNGQKQTARVIIVEDSGSHVMGGKSTTQKSAHTGAEAKNQATAEMGGDGQSTKKEQPASETSSQKQTSQVHEEHASRVSSTTKRSIKTLSIQSTTRSPVRIITTAKNRWTGRDKNRKVTPITTIRLSMTTTTTVIPTTDAPPTTTIIPTTTEDPLWDDLDLEDLLPEDEDWWSTSKETSKGDRPIRTTEPTVTNGKETVETTVDKPLVDVRKLPEKPEKVPTVVTLKREDFSSSSKETRKNSETKDQTTKATEGFRRRGKKPEQVDLDPTVTVTFSNELTETQLSGETVEIAREDSTAEPISKTTRKKLFSSDEDFDITPPNFPYSTYKIGLIPKRERGRTSTQSSKASKYNKYTTLPGVPVKTYTLSPNDGEIIFETSPAQQLDDEEEIVENEYSAEKLPEATVNEETQVSKTLSDDTEKSDGNEWTHTSKVAGDTTENVEEAVILGTDKTPVKKAENEGLGESIGTWSDTTLPVINEDTELSTEVELESADPTTTANTPFLMANRVYKKPIRPMHQGESEEQRGDSHRAVIYAQNRAQEIDPVLDVPDDYDYIPEDLFPPSENPDDEFRKSIDNLERIDNPDDVSKSIDDDGLTAHWPDPTVKKDPNGDVSAVEGETGTLAIVYGALVLVALSTLFCILVYCICLKMRPRQRHTYKLQETA